MLIPKIQAALYATGKRLQGYRLLKNPSYVSPYEVNMIKTIKDEVAPNGNIKIAIQKIHRSFNDSWIKSSRKKYKYLTTKDLEIERIYNINRNKPNRKKRNSKLYKYTNKSLSIKDNYKVKGWRDNISETEKTRYVQLKEFKYNPYTSISSDERIPLMIKHYAKQNRLQEGCIKRSFLVTLFNNIFAK